MSDNTIGVVLTPCKDVFFVVGLVEEALYRALDDEAARLGVTRMALLALRNAKGDALYRAPSPTISSVARMAVMRFAFAGEQRALYVNFACDTDHEDLGDKKLTLLFGAWGRSVQIMERVLRPLGVLGRVLLCENEGCARDFRPVTESCANWIDALRRRMVNSSELQFQRLFEALDAASLDPKFIERSIGLPMVRIRSLLDSDWGVRQAKLDEFIGAAA